MSTDEEIQLFTEQQEILQKMEDEECFEERMKEYQTRKETVLDAARNRSTRDAIASGKTDDKIPPVSIGDLILVLNQQYGRKKKANSVVMTSNILQLTKKAAVSLLLDQQTQRAQIAKTRERKQLLVD